MTFDFRPGDTIAVHQKIREGEKTRIQVFEGVVLGINRRARSFKVRKMSDNIGVERIWPIDSPWIEKIEVKKKAKKIRRAKLYYLRGRTKKQVTKITS